MYEPRMVIAGTECRNSKLPRAAPALSPSHWSAGIWREARKSTSGSSTTLVATARRAKMTATFSSWQTRFLRIPCRICTSSTSRLIRMMLPRMMTIATSTEMGSVYMSVVVGMTTAVQMPEGMMYLTSEGTWNGPQGTVWLDLSLIQPNSTTTATAKMLPPMVLLNRNAMSDILGSRSWVKYFTSTPVT